MQSFGFGWLGATIASSALVFGLASCTPDTNSGNDNEPVGSDNGPGQPIPTELDVEIEGQGAVAQESIGNNLIQLTAIAEDGWAFDEWFGSVNSLANPLTVSLETNTNIGARFAETAPPPVDADGDSVADSDDDCPGTAAGVDVDTNGCAPNQLDSDNDGVANLDDICPETPAGSTVNTDGCAPNELDTDTDGITDDIDACPETPDGVSVGADGCAPSEVDSDSDGVTDDADDCPNTEDGVEVGDDGCPIPDGCDGASGDCFTSHATGGCGDAVCCSLVCDSDDLCCAGSWDAGCAALAIGVCPNAPPQGGGGGPNGNGNQAPSCTADAECELGFNCIAAACAAVATPDIELGDHIPYTRIVEDGELIIRQGFQGGNHIFMSIKAVGFSPGAAVSFTRGVQPDGTTLPLVVNSTVTQFFEAQDDGTQLLQQVFVFIDGTLPQNYDDLPATVTITVTEQANPANSATLIQRVVLAAEP